MIYIIDVVVIIIIIIVVVVVVIIISIIIFFNSVFTWCILLIEIMTTVAWPRSVLNSI